MQEHIFDIAIVGGGASGIFSAIHLPKNLSKIILEKTNKIGTKVLLSGWERCNVSNMYIEDEKDYVGENKKILLSLFHHFSQYDMIHWLEKEGIKTHTEDNGRIILDSGKSEEIVKLFEKKIQENDAILKTNFSVNDIEKKDDIFVILWENGEKICAKKVIIATGGKSFAQIGTDWWGYNLAKKFGIEIVEPYKGLCGITTKEDFSSLSWISCLVECNIYDKEKNFFKEKWNMLFTHFWISWPLIFHIVLKIGEYIRNKGITYENEIAYIKENIDVKLIFSWNNIPKKILNFPLFDKEKNEIILKINDFRSWKEAKVTGGGVKLNELNKNFESKKVSGLYFIGEVLDITGKSGGFNLQLAWSEAYVLAKSFFE